ncbi:membrane protein [Enterobacterales bacterium]|nr:membrane protein [Enterobacterales bacterium]
MLELLESLIFAAIMVPVFIAVILGLIWGMGSVFNVISNVGHSKEKREQTQQR